MAHENVTRVMMNGRRTRAVLARSYPLHSWLRLRYHTVVVRLAIPDVAAVASVPLAKTRPLGN